MAGKGLRGDPLTLHGRRERIAGWVGEPRATGGEVRECDEGDAMGQPGLGNPGGGVLLNSADHVGVTVSGALPTFVSKRRSSPSSDKLQLTAGAECSTLSFEPRAAMS